MNEASEEWEVQFLDLEPKTWEEFEGLCLGCAVTIRRLPDLFKPPATTRADLEALSDACETFLDKVLPLELEPVVGQGLVNLRHFNFLVFDALLQGDAKARGDRQRDDNFPQQAITAVRRLRVAVSVALESDPPRRGNDTRRDPKTAIRAQLASFFAAEYFKCFNKKPGRTRRNLDLLRKMSETAGAAAPEGFDYGALLRRR